MKREIDVDPEAMTDALILGILEVPVLRKGEKLIVISTLSVAEVNHLLLD